MAQMTEIRWHGRGGQGAKTVAEFLALVALREGKYSQGFPEYGPERSGAPIKGYTRMSDEPIKMHSAVYNPHIVLVLDTSLLDVLDVCEGLLPGGIVIANTSLSPQEMIERHPVMKDKKVWTVDATAIARDEIGRPIPNMPMLGALVKATGAVSLETVQEGIRAEFAAKFSEKILDGNIRAVARAADEARSN